MDHHIKEFYCISSGRSPKGHFHKVIMLNEHPEIEWESISKKVPNLCKGWYELTHLSLRDRIEFTRDFWLTKLPYHPKLSDFLMTFFASLDDINVVIVQQKFDDPFEAHLVYSNKGDAGFFRGCLPASEEKITDLQKNFSDYLLPTDYLSFLQIHDGFSKTTDVTGLIKSSCLKEAYQDFQMLLAQQEPIMTTRGLAVNPKSLIPFYESFGMPFYQCFWGEWYPENKMGNVYYSGNSKTISDVQNKRETSSENMAFPTFTDWLMFYLERID